MRIRKYKCGKYTKDSPSYTTSWYSLLPSKYKCGKYIKDSLSYTTSRYSSLPSMWEPTLWIRLLCKCNCLGSNFARFKHMRNLLIIALLTKIVRVLPMFSFFKGAEYVLCINYAQKLSFLKNHNIEYEWERLPACFNYVCEIMYLGR